MNKKETAKLICPYCSHTQRVGIPHNSCLAFHECGKCQKIISVPEESKHCCVICEYSDKKCPVAHTSHEISDIKYILTLAIIAFIFHIIWENAQAPLYQGYESLMQHFWVCFMGTLGDVGITLSVLAVLWLAKARSVISLDKNGIIALVIIGFFIAVFVEQNALLGGKWAYMNTMPLIPYFDVGLTPVLQIAFLLPLTFFVTQKLYTSK